MKVLAFLAVLGFAVAVPLTGNDAIIDGRGLIEDGINKTLNDILANLTETITIDELPIDFGDSEVLSGGLNATSITINGVKNLVASQIKLDIFSLTLDLTLHISELLVNLKYWADALLLDLVPLYGEGRISVALEDVDLEISGAADLTDGLSLTNLTVLLTLADATFDLNGLINNPEFSALVSAALNDNFVTFVDNNAEVISSVLGPIVELILNDVLGGGDDDDPNTQALAALVQQYRTY